MNALRFHPVDFWLNGISSSLILILIGVPADVVAMFGLMNFAHGQLQHSNLQIKCGPLNWLFSMAELHRWHHSPYEQETNTNYGQTLIVWDIVFGTRFLPKDRLPGEHIGIDRLPNFPTGYWAQLISPFRWAKTKTESAPTSAPVGDN